NPRLEDALAGWRVAWQTSSWSEGDRTLWETTLGLVQVKPGAVSLPGLSVRLRESGNTPWQDISWPEPLNEPRDVAPIIEVPPEPPPVWPPRLKRVLPLVLLLAGGAVLLRVVHRLRARRQAPLPAWRRALGRLEHEQDLAAVTTIVRAFLEEQGLLPATRL